ncbi:MAG: inorganic phosphate transporter [Planctomycetota bacterium]|nr:inorganic phosphate transporter [Planctomycetota bacterium]
MSIAGFIVLLLAVFFLAWSNGANDNFKGVATLYGSGTCRFRTALIVATLATLLGSLVSVVFAATLVKAFSGKGIVPPDLIDATLLTSVGISGAITIFIATILGMPTSTTHALTGALVGAALMADPSGVGWRTLATKFAQPLLLSPILAILLTSVIYIFLRRLRRATGVKPQTCICIAGGAPQPVTVTNDGLAILQSAHAPPLQVSIGEEDQCIERYVGRVMGLNAQSIVDSLHYLSGAAVCFARAVNDTPKIAALLLAGSVLTLHTLPSLDTTIKLSLVAIAMAMGGLLQSRKVAETMSKRITSLNTGQGLTANLVTAFLVLGASRMGVPVSTTHVSCGSIFGIGAVNGNRHWSTIGKIALTWATTLPFGFVLGMICYTIISSLSG